jgi:hypothetical protein
VLPLLPSLAGLLWRISPPPFLATWGACALCYMSFLLLLFIIQFFVSFFPGWGSVCPGSYADLAQGCLWSTVHHLAHLVVHVFPSCLGTGIWQWPRGPPGLRLMLVGMLCAGWRCGEVKVLPLLGGFSFKVYLQHLSKILL